MHMRLGSVFLLLLVFAAAGPASAAGFQTPTNQDKTYHAERFDVDIEIQKNGSLLITETVDYRFDGGPFTFVFREINPDLTDGAVIQQALVDGRSYPPGESAGQVEITGRDPLRVEWHFEPTSSTTRTFTLVYRLEGVVRQEEGVDLLRFQPLPDEFEFPIDRSTITIYYPSSAELAGRPELTAGSGEITQNTDRITITANNIEPHQTIIFDVPFTAGSLIATPPRWQARQALGRSLVPVWLAAGLIILTTAVAGAVVSWRRHRPDIPQRSWTIDTPPNEPAAPLAGVLTASGAVPAWHHALAALFDLAARGYIIIEEFPKKRWFGSTDFRLIQSPKSESELRPHESALLALLFTDKKMGRTDEVNMSKLSGVIVSSRWKRYADVLKQELKTAGYWSPQRGRTRLILIVIGIVLMVLGGLAFVPAIAIGSWAQAWPIIVPAALLIGGSIYLMTGTMLPPLTDEAAALAADWRQFFAALKQITKGRLTVDGTLFEIYLPYAAAAGLLTSWVKWFEKQENVDLPPYFKFSSASPADGFAAFVALASVSSSSGGAAAGAAAGAGAAGGGSAGAG